MTGSEDTNLEKLITRYSRVGIPAAIAVGAVVAGYVLGAPGTVLVLAGGALIAVIATFWASVRTLSGETPLSGADAYSIGAMHVEDEQKRSVIRAINELRSEHRLGKISDEDFEVLETKYREEAKRLLRAIDERSGPRRAEVEALVARRLRREGLGEELPEPLPSAGDASEQRSKQEKTTRGAKKKKRGRRDAAIVEREAPPVRVEVDAPAAAAGVCSTCGTENDEDAVFCKKCGARQREDVKSDESAAETEEAERDESLSKKGEA